MSANGASAGPGDASNSWQCAADSLHFATKRQLGSSADVADLVVEMTDDKSLPKMERKRLQIEQARHMSRDRALVKLADKICNLRDMVASPPENLSLERPTENGNKLRASPVRTASPAVR